MHPEPPLAPGMPVVLLEGNWLHDAHVTGQGQGAGFVSIMINEAVRLVRRPNIYVLPAERKRLVADLQNGINQLEAQLDKLAHKEDPIPFQESA